MAVPDSLAITAARAIWAHDHRHPAPDFPTGDPYVDDPYLCRARDAVGAVLGSVSVPLRLAWSEGFDAATSAAPGGTWFEDWDAVANPYEEGAR
jgi:hypothetical protein